MTIVGVAERDDCNRDSLERNILDESGFEKGEVAVVDDCVSNVRGRYGVVVEAAVD